MRYQIRGTDGPDVFQLYDLKEGMPVTFGNWQEIKMASQEMNLEDMAREAAAGQPKMLRRRQLSTMHCRILGPVVKETDRNWVVGWGSFENQNELNLIAWIWTPLFMLPRISKHLGRRDRLFMSGVHDYPCPQCPDYGAKTKGESPTEKAAEGKS